LKNKSFQVMTCPIIYFFIIALRKERLLLAGLLLAGLLLAGLLLAGIGMSFTLSIDTDFSPQEVTEAIHSALEHEKHVAKYKVKRYSIICEDFEEKFGFGSGELRAKFETGNIGEESDFFDWYAAKRGLDHWRKRLEILSGISLQIGI